MEQKIIEARMFDKAEYGFDYYCLQNFNHGNVYLEQIVIYDDIKCFEYNSYCISLYNSLKSLNIKVAYFEYKNGGYDFYNRNMENITKDIPNSIMSNFVTTLQRTIHSHRYIINEDFILVKQGTLGVNQNTQMSVDKMKIMTKDNFIKHYNELPAKSYSFSKIHI